MSRGKGEALARWQVGQISVQNQTPFPPETFKGSNKPCVHQDPRTQQRLRTVFEHLLWRCRSAVVCRRDRGSGRGYGIHALGGGHHQPWYRAARTYIVLGNRLLEGTTEPRAPGSRRKEQLPHRRLACGCRESPVKAWVSGGPCRVGDTDYSRTCLRSFKGRSPLSSLPPTQFEKKESESEVAQSCPTLFDPIDCTLPGSSFHGILQATGVGCHFLLQGIFLTQGLNPGLLHSRQTL